MRLFTVSAVAILTIAVMAEFPVSGCTQLSPEAKKARHREHALNYFEKGQYYEALIEWKNLIKIDPKDADGHYRLALTYMKLGGPSNLQEAFSELLKTVDLDASNRDAHLKLGGFYLLGNEPAKARERAEIVLVLAPKDTEGLVLRGQSLINMKQYHEGIAELKKAIELNPTNIATYIDLARVYVLMKDQSSAEKTLEQAVTVDPRSTDARLARGDLRFLTGKKDEAEAEYKRALEIAPDNESLYLKLAGFYRLVGKWAEAEAVYQSLAAAKPKDEKPQILLGDYYSFLGDGVKALASYQRAAELNPSSTMARDKLIAHYLDTGKLDEVEHRVQAILAKNSKDLDGRFFEARLRLAKGKAAEAILSFRELLMEQPRSAPAHLFLGLALAQTNEVGQARQELSEAVKLAPNAAESRTALAAIYLTEGSFDQAIEEAQAAIRLNARNVQAAVILGDAYFFRKGDLAKSRQVFEALTKALPKDTIGYFRLGLVARAEKKDAEALSHFEKALDVNPTFIEPLYQVVDILLLQGKAQEARDRVARQLEVSPNNALIYNLLGRIGMATKDFDQAEAAFKKALGLNNDFLLAYLNMGELYRRTGKWDQAAQEYEAALAKDPTLLPTQILLGIIHEQRKDYEKAKARYETALKLNPKFAPAANNLAWILIEQGGNSDLALSYAQIAREQGPNDPNIADTLGWIYYKKHAYVKAVSLLKEAADKLHDNPIVLYHYGMAQYKNGNKAAAQTVLESSLKLSQTFPGAEDARQTLKDL